MSFQFFNLEEAAFSIAPNPKYWFMSDRHQEALKQLMYGLDSKDHAQSSGGFVLLTGEVGTGKTTALRTMLKQLPSHCQLAHIVHPGLNSMEMLAAICDGFDIDYQSSDSPKYFIDLIEAYLRQQHAADLQCILVIDEAQHLGVENLELLRLLTNIETDVQKLLRVVLIGQPELQALLAQSNLRQLAQRITARYHLLALDSDETQAYVTFRLQVAGANRTIFSRAALKRLYFHSGGVPRLINLIAERAMQIAADNQLSRVEVKQLYLAAQQTNFSTLDTQPLRWWPWALCGVTIACAAAFSISLLNPDLFAALINGQPKPAIASEPKQVNGANQLLLAESLPEPVLDEPVNQLFVMDESVELQSVIQENWQSIILESNSQASALQKLLRIWGYEVSLAQSRCELVTTLSLQCKEQTSDWHSLKQLNYPAIVSLNIDDNAVYALLRHVREGELELWFDQQRVFVEETWFKRYWQGQMMTLWQQPSGFEGLIKPGARGAIVFWLEQSLSQLQNRSPRALSYYDEQLEASVTQFQLQHQLKADGIVGEQTMIKLMQAIQPLQPQLLEGNS
ncbi:AAA family ATPase [Alginatibacterium sediminis]|uniref:AAA family ATPase n=1 Tax=Alginatibacterium sediminis TaxID=2164068 RepID=A0A420ECN0_9ALTE|nr:ExeA family protein [Alginatibacterium sediminis]RKF18440.1 AAA family ATPase [Alginatibacterium sediminis]